MTDEKARGQESEVSGVENDLRAQKDAQKQLRRTSFNRPGLLRLPGMELVTNGTRSFYYFPKFL